MAGYSKKSLADKLGIKEGFRVAFLRAPKEYEQVLGVLPESLVFTSDRSRNLDFVHLFVEDSKELTKMFPRAKSMILKAGTLWVSWPKKSSKLSTDLTGNTVRTFGLEQGLVDVKVAAIDETWSGLKFVYRLKDR